MAVTVVDYADMLSLADLYFYTKTAEGYSYRFQWSNKVLKAAVDGVVQPNIADYYEYDDGELEIDDDYYPAVSYYDYITANKNDNTSQADSYILKIYDKATRTLVQEISTAESFADVVLDDGEYLWEVTALRGGQVIKTSASAYMLADSTSIGNNYYYAPDYNDSSSQHQISQTNGNGFFSVFDINSIDGNTSAFFVCSESAGSYGSFEELAYNAAKAGGYLYSISAANMDFDITENCLFSAAGIYIYQNGNWVYHAYNLESNTADFCQQGNYFSLDDPQANEYARKLIYRYNPQNSQIELYATATSPVFDFSPGGIYYQSYSGVYSLSTNRQVLAQYVDYGEYTVFDDVAMNIYCLLNNYYKTDDLEEGQAGQLTVAYTPLNGETAGLTQTYTIYQSNSLEYEIESEDVLDARIGNCICYSIQLSDWDAPQTKMLSVVHVIENGMVTETITNYFDNYFNYSINADGDLVAEYYDSVSYQNQVKVLYKGVAEKQYADLQITDLKITPDTIQEGDFSYAEIILTVANKGNIDAGEFTIYVYAGDTVIGESNFYAFDRNSSYELNVSAYLGTLPAGTNNIRVVVDAHNTVEESNENNNDRTAVLTVVPTPKYADLQVSNISTPLPIISAGEPAVIEFSIANFGEAGAMASHAYIYDDATDELLGQVVVSSLLPGTDYRGSFNIAAGKLSPGEHCLRVVADATERVAESDEYNNAAYYYINVEAALPPTPPTPPTPPAPVGAITFFTGNFAGGNDMLLTVTDNKIAILDNGKLWSEIERDSSWDIVGVEDFNRDGMADILRKHSSGLIMTDLSNGDGSFSGQIVNMLGAGWDIETTGDFDGDGNGDVLVADPDASAVIGLIGYWKDGTAWTLIDGYSPAWDMISAQDFDGDGTDDMLWRSTFTGADGHNYNAYCSWIMNNSNSWRIVSSARPDQWDYLCSGDFDGDGTADMAMVDGNGIVGIWGIKEGTLGGWAVLGTVDLSVNQLAGVGDYNNDGTDDIAWCDASTGLTVCWQVKNNAISSVQTIGVIA